MSFQGDPTCSNEPFKNGFYSEFHLLGLASIQHRDRESKSQPYDARHGFNGGFNGAVSCD